MPPAAVAAACGRAPPPPAGAAGSGARPPASGRRAARPPSGASAGSPAAGGAAGGSRAAEARPSVPACGAAALGGSCAAAGRGRRGAARLLVPARREPAAARRTRGANASAAAAPTRRRARDAGGRAARAWGGLQGPRALFISAAIGLSAGVCVLAFEDAIVFFKGLRAALPAPILAPAAGAALVSLALAALGRGAFAGTDTRSLQRYLAPGGPAPPADWALRAVGNTLLSVITLGSGCSLGPEAPAASLGANVAFAVSQVSDALGDRSAEADGEVDGARAGGASLGAPGPADRAVIVQALQGSKVVAKMKASEIDELMDSFRKVSVRRGEVLLREGDLVEDTDPGMYVTQEGLLDIYVAAAGDEGAFGKKVVQYSGGGQLIGELAVLFEAPRAATVVAATDCQLWAVDRRSFQAVGGRSVGSSRSLSMSPGSVVASGAAAGVAAAFNAPIAGIFFASEVVRPTGENSLDLTARLLAAALSAAVVTGGGGAAGSFVDADFAWRGGNFELVAFMALGVASGAVSYVFGRTVDACRRALAGLAERGVPNAVMPLLGGLATVLVSTWTASRVQFDGFDAFNEVLAQTGPVGQGGASAELSLAPLLDTRGPQVTLTIAALVALLASKLVLTALCQASGLFGGTYAPSLFMGACLGAAVGRCVALFVGGAAAVSSSATYLVVGAAAMLAANCNVPVTAVILALELAGGSSYQATLPLILGISLAFYSSTVLLPAIFEGLTREQALARLEEDADIPESQI